MAPSPKPQGGATTGNAAPSKPATNNGVITEPLAPAVNRKKAKRRAKEKARRDAITSSRTDDYASDELDDTDLAPPGGYPSSQTQQSGPQYDPRYPNDVGQYQDSSGAGYGYSDEDNQYGYDPAYATSNGVDQDPADVAAQGRKSKKKKKRTRSSQYDAGYEEPPPSTYYHAPPPPRQRMNISEDALRTVEQKVNDDIWETSSREERDRIRQFWLKLPERDRRDLVRIEKDAVLRKMKEQQKHSCSCTVCGRKRTAIEEELEQLYDAYYKELEQFANGERPPPTHAQEAAVLRTGGGAASRAPPSGRIHAMPDGEDEDDLDEDEDSEDDEEYDRDPYDVQGHSQSLSMPRQDFFSFGENLTVKGGILTVADDLLSNQGEKFIDMMEQLANARMRRENEAYASYSNQQQHLHDTHANHYPEDDDYDEEDYDDEEESLGEDYEEEDDEMVSMLPSRLYYVRC